MERFELELVSLSDEPKIHAKIGQALVAGFFMQVAHKEDKQGNYLIVKDHQVKVFMSFFAMLSDFSYVIWKPTISS